MYAIPRRVRVRQTLAVFAITAAAMLQLAGCSAKKDGLNKSPGTCSKTQLIEDRYEDGSLRLRKEVITGPDGSLINNGQYTRWHKNGRKEYEVTFIDGKKEGVARTWHQNGQLAREENYKDGKRHGTSTSWNEKGGKVKQESHFEGKPHGTWTVWKKKKIKWQQSYDHGRPLPTGEKSPVKDQQ